MDPLKDPDTLFVSSSAAAGPVTRFGIPAAGPGKSEYIGATRDPNDFRRLLFHEAMVVMITGDELRRFRREYSRAIDRGDLIRRTRSEFEAWTESEAKREDVEATARAKTKKEAAEAQKKAADEKESNLEVDSASEVRGNLEEARGPGGGHLPEFDGKTERQFPGTAQKLNPKG